MSRIEVISQNSDARVAVVSMRGLRKGISRCTMYALEDLIGQIDNADVIVPTSSLGGQRWLRRLRRAADDRTGRPGALVPCSRSHLDRPYDLLFVSCENVRDLLELGPPQRWVQSARHSVVYIEEYWERDISRTPGEVSMLKYFDQVLLSCQATVAPLREAIGRATDYLPPTVDALSLCPNLSMPDRCIDFYNMGRRSEPAHQKLLQLARQRNLFYLHDTIKGGEAQDHREHRRQFSGLLKRTKYFITNCAKFDVDRSNQGQEEVGSRYFEGAAAGAVLIGQIPNAPAFEKYFGWPDAVIPTPLDGSGLAELYESLERDPERVDRIRSSNVKNSLLQNDWVYFWRDLLLRLGLDPLPQVDRRIEELQSLAASICEPAAENLVGAVQ